jgi:hypothetical protein
MFLLRGRSGRDRIVVGFITTYAMSITTKVVSSNPAQARCTQLVNTTLCDKICQNALGKPHVINAFLMLFFSWI